MRSSKSILTIAIPTYNRSKSLEKTLNYLKKENDVSFEILISDNCSSDDTKELVERFVKSMPNLNYHRNDNNLGYSGNILKLYELSKTRYIWFLSDDEVILPNAIENILESLSKYKASVTLFNHIRVDPFNRKLTDGVEKDVLYNRREDLVDYAPIIRSCFISVVVIEKSLSLEEVKKVYDKNNVYFQLSLVILLLNNKFKFCEVSTPIVFRNTTYESGEFFKFILTDWLDAIFNVRKSKLDNSRFTNWAKKEIPNALQLYLSQKIGMYKYNGRPTRKTMRKIIKYYGPLAFIILLFPVFCFIIPSSLLKFLYKNKLNKIYGYKKARKIYNVNLNRVYKNKINSGFTAYR